MKSVAALKRAVVAALKADAGVATLVGANVFDIRPRESLAGAWIYVGPVNAQRYESECGLAWALRLRLYGASDLKEDLSRDKAWAVGDAIVAALHGTSPTLGVGAIMQDLQFEQAGDVVDPLSPAIVFADFTTMTHD